MRNSSIYYNDPEGHKPQWNPYPWPTVPDSYLGTNENRCSCPEEGIISCEKACEIVYNFGDKPHDLYLGAVAVVVNLDDKGNKSDEVFCPCSFLKQYNRLPHMYGTWAYNAVESCILLHESVHIRDDKNYHFKHRTNTDCARVRILGQYIFYPSVIVGLETTSECNAYTEMLECLENQIKQCGEDVLCEMFITIYIGIAKEGKKTNCWW